MRQRNATKNTKETQICNASKNFFCFTEGIFRILTV